jgi:DNA-directed RNA polymerase subunit E'/Rpb7
VFNGDAEVCHWDGEGEVSSVDEVVFPEVFFREWFEEVVEGEIDICYRWGRILFREEIGGHVEAGIFCLGIA